MNDNSLRAITFLFVTYVSLAGCETAPPRVQDVVNMPSGSTLAFGRIQVEGKTPISSGQSGVMVEFQNISSHQVFTPRLDGGGDFYALVPAGCYVIKTIRFGYHMIMLNHQSLGFSGDQMRTYVGTLVIRLPSDFSEGEILVLDELPQADRRFVARYPQLRRDLPITKGVISRNACAASNPQKAEVAVPNLLPSFSSLVPPPIHAPSTFGIR